MNKNKKGFTLIELLAVIVILAIIALIAVPVIMNIISSARKSAFKDTAYGIVKAGELYYTNKLLDVNGMQEDEVVFTFPSNTTGLDLNGSMPSSGSMKVTKTGKIALAISDGKYCVTKGLDDSDVTITEDVDDCVIPVAITDLSFTDTDVVAYVGEQTTLTPTIEPATATNTTLSWVSNDASIVTVENGVLTGVSTGSTTVTVATTDGSNITKTINVTVKTLYKNDIMKSEDSCIQSGNTCSSSAILSDEGIKVNVQVSEEENYDFYVIADNGTTLTLIMDRNLYSEEDLNNNNHNVDWISAIDYSTENSDNTTCNPGACSDEGPITLIETLKTRTSDWDNITSKSYAYSGLAQDETTRVYSDITETMKARVLTYKEATALGCSATNKSCPDYLVINLAGTGDSNTNAYWTSTAISSISSSSYIIMGNGYNNISFAGLKDNPVGIRPVIEITK